jgi:peptidyl-prolyl cis-trans isomerase SurA
MKKMLVIFALLLAIAAPAAMLAQDNIVEQIIVHVNSDVITRSEFERSREQVLNEERQRDAASAEAEFAKRDPDILRDLIDQQLLLQRGADMGLTADTEVVKRLDEIRQSMNLQTMEELEAAAQQQGVNFEDLKQSLRNNAITQQVITREVGSRVKITQEEVQAYYDAHKEEFRTDDQVRLSEILVAIPEQKEDDENKVPEEQLRAAAKKKIDGLLARLKKGESFEQIASKNSDGPTATQGGDIGVFKRGVLAKALEEQTFNLKAGQMTEPILTKQGYIILKVTQRTGEGVPELSQVERSIQERIYLDKLPDALREYLTKLREEAYIDIKAGYTDTGASPNQSKPLITMLSEEQQVENEEKKDRKWYWPF